VVVVSGAEGIGSLTALATTLRGATAVLVDPKQARLEQASALGIPYVVNPFRSSVPDELSWIAGDGLADAVIETTGNRDALPGLFAVLGPGSRVGFIHPMEYDVSVATLVDSGLRLVGLGTLLPNMREAVELSRETEVSKAVSLMLHLEELPDRMVSIARSREALLKTVVTLTRESHEEI
jgi:threonine dehydrogenase-like Zn-dependent dehydrogenase